MISLIRISSMGPQCIADVTQGVLETHKIKDISLTVVPINRVVGDHWLVE